MWYEAVVVKLHWQYFTIQLAQCLVRRLPRGFWLQHSYFWGNKHFTNVSWLCTRLVFELVSKFIPVLSYFALCTYINRSILWIRDALMNRSSRQCSRCPNGNEQLCAILSRYLSCFSEYVPILWVTDQLFGDKNIKANRVPPLIQVNQAS